MKKQYIYAAVSILIWSTLAAFTKSLLGTIPNFQVLFICSSLAFLFLLAVNLFTGGLKTLKLLRIKDILKMVGLGFVGIFLYKALYNVGLIGLTSQQACVINYLWPIMTVIFSCLILKERVTVMKIVAMVCSFVGIAILTGGIGTSEIGFSVIFGIVGCFIAAACYGLFSVLNKRENYDLKVSMMIFWLTSALVSLPLGLVFETWVPVSGSSWAGLLWLGILGDGLAYLTWAMALCGLKNTATVANLAYLTPFFSVIVSMVFLDEPFDFKALIALVFIVGGIMTQSITAAIRHKKEENRC